MLLLLFLLLMLLMSLVSVGHKAVANVAYTETPHLCVVVVVVLGVNYVCLLTVKQICTIIANTRILLPQCCHFLWLFLLLFMICVDCKTEISILQTQDPTITVLLWWRLLSMMLIINVL